MENNYVLLYIQTKKYINIIKIDIKNPKEARCGGTCLKSQQLVWAETGGSQV